MNLLLMPNCIYFMHRKIIVFNVYFLFFSRQSFSSTPCNLLPQCPVYSYTQQHTYTSSSISQNDSATNIPVTSPPHCQTVISLYLTRSHISSSVRVAAIRIIIVSLSCGIYVVHHFQFSTVTLVSTSHHTQAYEFGFALYSYSQSPHTESDSLARKTHTSYYLSVCRRFVPISSNTKKKC